MSEPAIGELRHELLLEEQVRTAGPGGGASLAWQPVATLWAAIRPRSGTETVVADRRLSRVDCEIWLRSLVEVAPAMRLRGAAGTFSILAVLQSGGREQWLRCLARREPA